MSDKNTYNKDFVDQGWENMSSILDKEMPVKKKKRIFLFWIFLIGVIACGATMWFNLYSTHSDNITSEKIEITSLNRNKEISNINNDVNLELAVSASRNNSLVEKEIIEEKNVDKENEGVKWNKVVEDKTITTELKLVEKENSSRTQFYNLNYGIQTLKNNKAVGHLLFNENRNKEEATIIEIKKGEVEIVKPKIFNNELEINSGISNEENLNQEKIEEREKVNVLKPIAFSDTDYIENLGKKKLPFNSKLGYWEFGLEAGFVFQNKNELGGKLAFVATKRFRPKWSFHIGLEHNVQFVNYSVAEQEQEDSIITNIGTGVDPGDAEFIALESNPIKISNHVLKIPVLIGYKFNRSFEMSVGIIGSTQIYSRSNSINLNEIIVLPAPTPYESTDTSRKITPTFDIQSSIGMTYYPNEKWGINIRYDNGFLQRKIKYKESSTSNSELIFGGYNSRNRQLSLSARMYF